MTAALTRYMGRAKRAGTTLGVAFVGLAPPDPSKEGGVDELAAPLVELLLEHLSADEQLIRWSDHEFVCLLPGGDQRGVAQLMHTVAIEFARRTLTCFDCGVAVTQPGDTPAAVIERARHAMSAASTLREPAGDRGISILVVEDDADVSAMFRLALMQAGYRTAVALDGANALRLAAEFEPDLILLDIQLPVLNGKQVLRRLRADGRLRRLAVVVLSSRGDDPQLRARVLAYGAVDCVVKSHVTPKQLVEAIPGWLRARRQVG